MTVDAPAGYGRPDTTVVPADSMCDVLTALGRSSQLEASMLLLATDTDGNELEDLTPWVMRQDQAWQVVYDCTAEVGARLNGTIARDLEWGSDVVAPQLLLRSGEYASGRWQQFPVGLYVVTSPGRDNLDAAGKFSLTGYDKCYLLQGDAEDAFSFAAGSKYSDGVLSVMRKAGLVGATAALSTAVSYPGDWVSKTLPAPMSAPLGSGQTYLQIINGLLDASGCNPLGVDRYGRYTVDLIADAAAQSLAWRWSGGRLDNGDGTYTAPPGADFTSAIVQYATQGYQGDVWNRPNRWRFIQSGLTFTPTHTDGSDGMYVVDNKTTPPGDQATVGRVIASVQTITASGKADLIAQANKIVTADKAQAERITLSTTPWPAAWRFDVFQYSHPALPYTPLRRVQSQGWTLPLDGRAMQWTTNVVGLS